MKETVIGIFIVICLFYSEAFSQNNEASKALCRNAGNQLLINACAAREFKDADLDLRQIYKQLLVSWPKGKTREKGRRMVKQTQLFWFKYRDSICRAESLIYAGGSNLPAARFQCLASVTRERNKRLKDFLDEIKLLF